MVEETYQVIEEDDVKVAQAAGVIALGSVASRVLGMVREMVKAGLFGAGPHVDALNAALRVPNTLYDLLVGGMISSALVPVLSDYTPQERRAEFWRLLSVLITLALVALSVIVLVGEVLAPQIIGFWVGGLPEAYRELAATLLRIVLPATIFLSVSSIFSGALYALKRFTLPAFTAVAFNAAMVLCALALGWRWGVYSMALGMVVGALVQVLLQLPGLRGARIRLLLDFRHPALRRIWGLYIPIVIGLLVDTVAVLLSYSLASYIGPGAITWMEYAATVIQFPLGLVVAAVSLAILPTLSQQASESDLGPFRSTLAKGLRLVLFLVIPATAGLYVLANPIVGALLERGAFTAQDTLATAEALRYALLGLLFTAIDQPLIFAFYARKDTRTPALVGIGTTLFYIILALIPWYFGWLTLPLLVLVNSLKLTAHAIAMLVLTRVRLGGLSGRGLGLLVLKATGASLLMAGVAWGVVLGLDHVSPAGFWGYLLSIAGAGGIGMLVYAGAALMLKIEEVHVLRAAWRDGLARLTGVGR